MLDKRQLQEILSVCLKTGGDFAEIFEERKVTMVELRDALQANFGYGLTGAAA